MNKFTKLSAVFGALLISCPVFAMDADFYTEKDYRISGTKLKKIIAEVQESGKNSFTEDWGPDFPMGLMVQGLETYDAIPANQMFTAKWKYKGEADPQLGYGYLQGRWYIKGKVKGKESFVKINPEL